MLYIINDKRRSIMYERHLIMHIEFIDIRLIIKTFSLIRIREREKLLII